MTQTAVDKKPSSPPDRQPIAVEKLLITHQNPHGVKLPDGIEGKGERMQHTLLAGEQGDVKTEIDFLPWVRAFRVKRSHRIGDAWKPMGKPFFIHETWVTWVPAGEQ
jgi:hypothetical protein